MVILYHVCTINVAIDTFMYMLIYYVLSSFTEWRGDDDVANLLMT